MTRRPLLLLAAILLALLIVGAFLLWLWVGLLRDLTQVSAPVGLTPTPSDAAPTAASRALARPVLPASPDPAADQPAARAAQGPGVVAGEGAALGPSAAQWAKLRYCESRGHYDERANPNYRGAYQIGFYEWTHYGGAGRDPADASPVEQDAVALRIWQTRGWEPWQASSSCTGLR